MTFSSHFTFAKTSPFHRKAPKISKKDVYFVHPSACLTKKEIREFFKAAEKRKVKNKAGVKDWIFIKLASHTGLRISEIARLNCSHVVLKDSFYPYIFVENGKTPFSKRIIPLNKEIVHDLETYFGFKKHWNEKTEYGEPFLRSPMSKGGYYNRSGLYEGFKRVRALVLNVKNVARFHPHSLRHTFASFVYEKQGDIKTVQELLGHSSPEITSSIYIHVFVQKKKKAVQGLYT